MLAPDTMRTPIVLVLAALLATASCGTEDPDERPPTAEYVVPAIFRPSCGTAGCHSSATARKGLVLDTIAGVCEASNALGPLTIWMVDDPPTASRMPLDSPLPDADLALLQVWYLDGIPAPGCP
jgi:hypothetical protein